jgi:hypothetical protein
VPLLPLLLEEADAEEADEQQRDDPADRDPRDDPAVETRGVGRRRRGGSFGRGSRGWR